MLVLKDSSIEYQGIQPELAYALGVAEVLKRKLGYNTVVTSLMEGKHNPGSLHPKGRAGDLRTTDMTVEHRLQWFEQLETELKPFGFDVVWEGGVGATPATTGAHIHIEFDPDHDEHFWHLLDE
jgi:hypothetical protein